MAGTGGLSKHVVELSDALAERGHIVTAIVPEECSAQLSAKVCSYNLKPESKFTSYLYTLKLLLLVREIDPDVVHAHGKAASIHLAKIRPFIRAKCVGTVHWHHKRKNDFRGFERLDGVIGVGSGVLEPLANTSKAVIYNGVKPPKINYISKNSLITDFGLSPGWPLAVAIGRLEHGKGFHLLVEAWKDIEANLLVVGDGSEFQSLCELSAELGLKKKLRVTGAIPEAAKLLTVADLAIVSSYKEGFSYVIAEALISKTAVISTKVNGGEVLLPPEMVVPVGDVPALSAAIQRFFADQNLAMASFEDVFEWAERTLTLDKMAANVLGFYTELGAENIAKKLPSSQ